MFNESLEVVSRTHNTLTPSINYYGDKVWLRFTGSVLKQKVVTYSHEKVVNLYAVYEITNSYNTGNYPTLENALFGAVKITENAEFDKCRYFGYQTGFDRHGTYSLSSDENGRNVIILE